MVIVVKNEEEFEQRLKGGDKDISIKVVKTILNNLDTEKRFIHVLEIHLEETGLVVDITADRNDFYSTLEKNMDTLIHHEEYELCAQIQEALKKLPPPN